MTQPDPRTPDPQTPNRQAPDRQAPDHQAPDHQAPEYHAPAGSDQPTTAFPVPPPRWIRTDAPERHTPSTDPAGTGAPAPHPDTGPAQAHPAPPRSPAVNTGGPQTDPLVRRPRGPAAGTVLWGLFLLLLAGFVGTVQLGGGIDAWQVDGRYLLIGAGALLALIGGLASRGHRRD